MRLLQPERLVARAVRLALFLVFFSTVSLFLCCSLNCTFVCAHACGCLQGIERKATCQALFRKMLYLTECHLLIEHGSPAAEVADLHKVCVSVCGL